MDDSNSCPSKTVATEQLEKQLRYDITGSN